MRKHAFAFSLASLLAVTPAAVPAGAESARAVLWQPSMNVFRRFAVDAEKMFEFYGNVLGFEQLSTIDLGSGTGVARFQAGAQELKPSTRSATAPPPSRCAATATTCPPTPAAAASSTWCPTWTW